MMQRPTTPLIATFCIWLLAACSVSLAAAPGERGYSLVPDQYGMVLKTPDGRTVFQYMTKKPAQTNLTANSVCCLYPTNTPSGVRAVDFAPGDHRHHRGIFLAWHTMTCGDAQADFWGWGAQAPTEGRVIRNRDVRLAASDAGHAVVEASNDWLIGDRTVMAEQLTIDTQETKGVYVIDLLFRLTPQVDVTLAQSAFGGLCVKGRKEGKAVYTSPEGEIKLPNPHHLKPESDWPAAAWYDYTVQLDEGKTVGVAVVDHAKNPPSKWHNLEPIAMVNPCIVAPAAVSLKKDQTLVLRYRVVVHDGPTPTKLLNALSDEFRTS